MLVTKLKRSVYFCFVHSLRNKRWFYIAAVSASVHVLLIALLVGLPRLSGAKGYSVKVKIVDLRVKPQTEPVDLASDRTEPLLRVDPKSNSKVVQTTEKKNTPLENKHFEKRVDRGEDAVKNMAAVAPDSPHALALSDKDNSSDGGIIVVPPFSLTLIEDSIIRPEYTEEALDAGYETNVDVDVFVNHLGVVTKVKLLKKVLYGMERSIIRASRNARFESKSPATGIGRSGWKSIRFSLRVQ